MGGEIIGVGVCLATTLPLASDVGLVEINEGQSVVMFVDGRKSRFLPLPFEKQPL